MTTDVQKETYFLTTATQAISTILDETVATLSS